MKEIDLKIKTGDSATSIAGIRKQIKDLDSAALNIGQGGKGFDELTKKSAELRDQLDDLKDSTQSLKGSGVEKLTGSFHLLKEGFQNADTDKLKTGFKALGTAMKAIPIFLLIEGLRLLAENFDAVVGFINGSTAAMKANQKQFEASTLAATTLSKALQREVDLLQAQGASEEKILAKKKEKLEADLKGAKASLLLAIQNQQLIKSNDSLYESYLRLSAGVQRFTGNTKAAEQQELLIAINKKERAEEFVKTQREAEELIKDITSQSQVAQATYVTKKNTEIKKSNEDLKKQEDKDQEDRIRKSRAETEELKKIREAFLTDIAKQKEEDQKKQDEIDFANSEKEVQKITNNIAARNELEKLANSKSLEGQRQNLENERQQLLANTELTEGQRLLIKQQYAEKEKQLRQQQFDQSLEGAQALTNSIAKITDLAFAHQLKQAKGNSKEELEIRKKQWKVNKAYGIVNATIDGIQGVAKALNNPYPLNLVLAAASAVAAAANVAAISAQEFTGAESGGGAGSVSGSAAIQGSISGASTNTAGTTFNQNVVGNVSGSGSGSNDTGNGSSLPPQRVFVLESDITGTQGTIAQIEEANSF